MRASRTAADHHCIAFHGKLDLSSLRTTQQRNRGHAVRVPGMHGLLQARAVLRSLTPGHTIANATIKYYPPQQALHRLTMTSLHFSSWRLVSVAGTLRHLYRNAMQMEVDFFNAQPDVSSAPSVGMLVIDFDDTCTVTDTTSLVFNTAIDATVEATQGAASHARCYALQMYRSPARGLQQLVLSCMNSLELGQTMSHIIPMKQSCDIERPLRLRAASIEKCTVDLFPEALPAVCCRPSLALSLS